MSQQEASYDHAIGLANQGRFAEALQIADQLSQARPEVVDFVTLRARLHFDNGDAAAALAVLDEALARLGTLPLQPPHRWASRGVIAHLNAALESSLNWAMGQPGVWALGALAALVVLAKRVRSR